MEAKKVLSGVIERKIKMPEKSIKVSELPKQEPRKTSSLSKISKNHSIEYHRFKLSQITYEELSKDAKKEVLGVRFIYDKKDKIATWKKAIPNQLERFMESVNPLNSHRYGNYQLKVVKTRYSSSQEKFVKENSFKIVTETNYIKYLFTGAEPRFENKNMFLIDLDGRYEPQSVIFGRIGSVKLKDKLTGYIEDYIFYNDSGTLQFYKSEPNLNMWDYLKYEPDFIIPNIRNKFKTWFKEGFLPYLPVSARLNIEATKYTDICDIILKVNFKELEAIKNGKLYAISILCDSLKDAKKIASYSGTKAIIGKNLVQHNSTLQDGGINIKRFKEYGYNCVLLIEPKDLEDIVFYTNKKGEKLPYYSRNTQGSHSTLRAIMTALNASLVNKNCRVIDKIVKCEEWEIIENPVLTADEVVQKFVPQRNLDRHCKKQTNLTLKENQKQLLKQGPLLMRAKKLAAEVIYRNKSKFLLLKNTRLLREKIISLMKGVVNACEEGYKPKYKTFDDAIIKAADDLVNLVNKEDFKRIKNIAFSRGSIGLGIKKKLLDDKSVEAKIYRKVMGLKILESKGRIYGVTSIWDFNFIYDRKATLSKEYKNIYEDINTIPYIVSYAVNGIQRYGIRYQRAS